MRLLLYDGRWSLGVAIVGVVMSGQHSVPTAKTAIAVYASRSKSHCVGDFPNVINGEDKPLMSGFKTVAFS